MESVNNISTIATMFTKQVEQSIINPRDYNRCEVINDFMFLYGYELFSSNLELFMSLLGFLKHVKILNPDAQIYSTKDFKNQLFLNN